MADDGDLDALELLLREADRHNDLRRFAELWQRAPDPAWRRARVSEHAALFEQLFPGLVWIPPGDSWRGSPTDEVGRFADEQLHRVTLTRPLLVGRTPVTQAQWTALMGNNPSFFRGEHQPERPVEHISWFDAVAYCNARSRAEGLIPAYELYEVRSRPGRLGFEARVRLHSLDAEGYRLPTEAEWEHATRAGTRTATWRGALAGPVVDPALDEIAWYAANSGGTTHAVGLRLANPWGLRDTLGLIWEWCQDGYEPYPDAPDAHLVDPLGGGLGWSHEDDAPSWRSVRGGCWLSQARFCRAAMRGYHVPAARSVVDSNESFGLRVVRATK